MKKLRLTIILTCLIACSKTASTEPNTDQPDTTIVNPTDSLRKNFTSILFRNYHGILFNVYRNQPDSNTTEGVRYQFDSCRVQKWVNNSNYDIRIRVTQNNNSGNFTIIDGIEYKIVKVYWCK